MNTTDATDYNPHAGQPELSWLVADLRRLDLWQAGYVLGYTHGIERGRQVAGQEWTDVTTAACRVGLQLTKVAEAEAYRRRPLPRGKTPAQIRAEARHSWAQVERRIAGEKGRRSA